MTLCNPKPWLQAAWRDGYAIGAFNANTLEQVQGIVRAAQAENAPAIIQVSHRALRYLGSGNEIRGLQMIAAIGKIAAESVTAPVALHLDHGTETEVRQAMALGFTSVMFDGDGLSLAENIAITQELRQLAQALDVCLEAEVGAVPKPDGAVLDHAAMELTDPEEAAAFVQATGIDSLAVALGSVHGMQDKHMRIDLARLRQIRERVQIPLVLHGSSGVDDGDIVLGIQLGLSKINIATQLNKAFTGAVRQVLAQDSSLVDPRKYLQAGRQAQEETVRERMRFLGSAGRAAGGGGKL